jgi:hypothetical protein
MRRREAMRRTIMVRERGGNEEKDHGRGKILFHKNETIPSSRDKTAQFPPDFCSRLQKETVRSNPNSF